MAAAIADRVRLLDTVARFGDDEFIVIAPGDAGGIVALRLRDAIAELPPVDGIPVSVSAAVVHHPADGATGDELVAASEAALARAREAGPGPCSGSSSPRPEMPDRADPAGHRGLDARARTRTAWSKRRGRLIGGGRRPRRGPRPRSRHRAERRLR